MLLIVIISIFTGCSNNEESKGALIVKWDNFYEGDNIKFYYEDPKEPNLQKLKKEYNLDEVVKDSKDDFDKALKLMEWLNGKIKFNKTSVTTKEDALGILKEGENNTLSDKDFAIVYSQAASSLGMYVRRGQFKPDSVEEKNKNNYYYVCEIWSDKYNKWILLDVVNNCYMESNGKLLSGIEVLNSGLETVTTKGVKNINKYIRKIKPYLYTYTIEIDNNIYGVVKSNSYITYINKNASIGGRDLIKPNIFVKEDRLFNKSPRIVNENKSTDKKSTLIFSQKKQDENSKEKTVTLNGAVFKDSGMLEGFFISVDDSSFAKINRYFTVTLKEGSNKVKFSEDGKKVSREIIIEYKK